MGQTKRNEQFVIFFSKMLTYKRAYSGVKIIIVRARPGQQL